MLNIRFHEIKMIIVGPFLFYMVEKIEKKKMPSLNVKERLSWS